MPGSRVKGGFFFLATETGTGKRRQRNERKYRCGERPNQIWQQTQGCGEKGLVAIGAKHEHEIMGRVWCLSLIQTQLSQHFTDNWLCRAHGHHGLSSSEQWSPCMCGCTASFLWKCNSLLHLPLITEGDLSKNSSNKPVSRFLTWT